MNTIGITSLIKANLTSQLSVFMDYIPEKKSLPAITYTHIVNGSVRLKDGKRTGVWNTWRIIVVAKRTDYKNCQAIHAELVSKLDNTQSTEFKNCFVIYEDSVPTEPDDKTCSYIIDIKTYDREL